eukprot:598123-Rhodomonas_salina.1
MTRKRRTGERTAKSQYQTRKISVPSVRGTHVLARCFAERRGRRGGEEGLRGRAGGEGERELTRRGRRAPARQSPPRPVSEQRRAPAHQREKHMRRRM